MPGSSGVLTTSFVEGLPADMLGGGVLPLHPPRIHSQIPDTTTGAVGAPAGSGTWQFDYTVPGYVVGRTKSYVAVIDDPATFSGQSRSNRLYVQYGP